MALTFDDHPGFQREFLATAVGAAAMGAAGALVPSAGVAGLPAVAVGSLVGAAAGLSWAEAPRSALRLGLRLVAIAGGLGAAAAVGSPWVAPLALGLVIAIGASRSRALIAGGAALAAALVAAWAARRTAAASELSAWPELAVGATTGLFLGTIASFGTAARHLGWAADPIRAAYRKLPPLVGEPRALVERGLAIWHDTAALPADDRALVADGVGKLFTVATRLATTRAIDGAAIDGRIAELDARIAACTDAVAAEQYAEARAALVDQRRYAASVAASRERIVARMHHCVATLEKFRMACAQADASAAARDAADARSAMAVLGDLSEGLAEASQLAAPAAGEAGPAV